MTFFKDSKMREPDVNNNPFVIEDIVRSYEWLGNSKYGFTELVAFHRDYRPGKEHYETNRKLRFVKIWYTKRPDEAVKFVKSFHANHTCCYGINPLPRILRSDSGGLRRARDIDIEQVTNCYLDIDPLREPNNEQIAEIELFLVKAKSYFEDLKINQPTRAFTGRGYHLLFAMRPIKVREHPDIKDRLNQFRQNFLKAFTKDLSALQLKLDNTTDLSRVAKIYGTKKPTGRRVSRFYGDTRKEDEALREHLLNLSLEAKEDTPVKIPEALPDEFERLLRHDEEVRQLWHGTGKTGGDTSNTGYDFSLMKKCINRGMTDIRDLTAILALRPKGGVRMSGKGMQYVKLTIANAIKS